MPMNRRPGLSLDFERALRLAAVGHRNQVRKGSGVPYIEHPLAVAMILDRSGFDDETLIAGLLHDLVEDTDVSLEQIREQFGDRVAEIVDYCSEVKIDASGAKRPWIDRKRDHLASVANAPESARAVILADKLHNLISIRLDQAEGRPVWSSFHADRDRVLWYYGAMIDACRSGEPSLSTIADECRELLDAITAENV
jgi:(p)ppGpp synthase/HD superfamily hydrolase